MSTPADPIARNAPLRAAAVAAVMIAAAILSCFYVTNLDIGGHIAVGRETLKTGHIPDTDFFTHTVAGSPYPVHQWLGEVIVFGVDYLGGATGLVLLRMAIVLAGAVLLFRNARRENAPVAVAAAILLLLLVAARPRFFVRPMIASFVFLPLLQGWLADYRSGRSARLWPVLVLMTVWGHIHSGVLFGVLLLGGTLFAEGIKLARGRGMGAPAYRRLALFSAIAAALPFATMAIINPSGLKPLILPFLFFRNQDFRQMIGEYRPVDLAVDWPFNVVAGAVVLGMLIRPRRVDLTDLVIVGGFGILAYQAVRGILPLAAVSAPLLARTWGALAEQGFDRVSRGKGRPRSRANLANSIEAGILVGVIAAAFLFAGKATGGWLGFPFGFGKDPKHYPERTLDFLDAQGVRGNVFNTDVWASSLLWRWRGKRYPVYVDARLEAYPEEFWKNDYYRVLEAAPGWEDVLRKYDVQWCFVGREGGQADDKIGEVLWTHPEWGLAFWDDHAMIFIRRHGHSQRNDEILARWEFRSFHPRRPQGVQDLAGDALVRAANDLSNIVDWAPDSFLPRWTLAAAWTRLGHGPEAALIFEDLAGRPEAKDNAAFTASRAEAQLVAGDTAGWSALLAQAGRDPADPGERFAAAALLRLAGKTDSAERAYRDLLRDHPQHGDAMNNLALLLADRPESRGEARVLIDRAVELDPSDGYFLASRGEIRFRAGDSTGARDDLLRSLELLPPGDESARAHVGGWLSRID